MFGVVGGGGGGGSGCVVVEFTTLKLTVAADADGVSISVRDNGVGIGDPGRFSGLQNLRARARKHGGEFVAQTGGAGGTELRWTARLPR